MIDVAQIAEKSIPIFRKYGIKKVALFGSRARGDARPDSDVDFLYKAGDTMSLFEKARAQEELVRALGAEVDLVADTAVVNRMRPYIKKDLTVIYEG